MGRDKGGEAAGFFLSASDGAAGDGPNLHMSMANASSSAAPTNEPMPSSVHCSTVVFVGAQKPTPVKPSYMEEILCSSCRGYFSH